MVHFIDLDVCIDKKNDFLAYFDVHQRLIRRKNKAVYTTAPVAGGWAGAAMVHAGAIMILIGAVMIWAGACSNANFPTLKMPKNAKKAECDGPTDRPTDRHGGL